MATRNERVVLSLQDQGFSTGMARAAAQAALLDRALDGLDGSGVRVQRSMGGAAKSTDTLGVSARRNESSINQLTGRLRVLADVAAIIGPSIAPIGAVGIPAITGLAQQLGFAAIGLGTLIGASQGVGDALEAVNKAALEPTAENLAEARSQMERLSPAAQTFVSEMQAIQPTLIAIRDAGATGWFPGLGEALGSFEEMGPRVARIFREIGEVGGGLAAEGAGALAGPEWREFIRFVRTDAPPALEELGRTVGNLAAGMAELWMAFDPLNDNFSSWLLDISRGFREWADGLAGTQGFEDFVSYIRQSGPQVADALGSLADALIQITQAAAPLGGPVLSAITALANAIAAIADSPLGTPLIALATGMSAANLATRTLDAALGALGGTSEATSSKLSNAARAAGLLFAGFAAVDTIQSDVDGLNQTTNELANSLLNLESGGSLPEGLGNLGDQIERLADPNLAQSLQDTLSSALGGIGNDDLHDEGVRAIEALDSALSSIATSKDAEAAEEALRKVADSAGLSDSAVADLTDMLPRYRDAMAAAENSTTDTGDAASDAAAELERLTRATLAQAQAALTAFGAETSYREALKAARAQAKDNSAGLRGNSDAALANRRALENLASSWQQQRQAMEQAGASTERVSAKQRSARSAFIEVAQSMGVSEGRARALARAYFAVPERVNTDVTVNTGTATSQIASVKAALADIPRTIGVNVVVSRPTGNGGRSTGGGLVKDADGGFHVNGVRQFADGGWGMDGRYYERIPQIIRGGANILWGEQETGWEAYISGKPGMEDRNREILGIAAERLGMAVVAYADGGGAGADWKSEYARPPAPGSSGSPRYGRMDLPELRKALRGLNRELEKSEKSLSNERKQRDAVADRMRSLRADVSSGLRTELGGEVDPWSSRYAGGSYGADRSTLKGDIAEGREFIRLVKQLKAKGMSGAALAEIIGSGDIERARLYASLPRADVREANQLINTRDRVLAQAGSYAGSAAFGAQFRRSDREWREERKEHRELVGAVRKLEKTVEQQEKQNRESQRKGAQQAGQNRRRDGGSKK